MAQPANKKNSIALACVLFLASMFGLSYASVPFYDWFCRTTGFGGTTQVAASMPALPAGREITIRFDSNISSDLPWRFKPASHEIKVRLGEMASAVYTVENTSGVPSAGTATYNVTPPLSGAYFNKLECFCFTSQILKPHEKRDMTVRFFVDPELINDKNVATLDTITLSYTFYPDAKLPRLSQAQSQNATN